MSIIPTKQEPIAPKAFRHDINGLRAWAVLAVMLYHFGVPGSAGGFVGVDVFFVISGYLMTGIIVSRLSSDRFSLVGFYLDRCRRIIPALAVTAALVAAAGCCCWLVLSDPGRLFNVGRSYPLQHSFFLKHRLLQQH